MSEITVDKIIETMASWVAKKQPIDPGTWIDAAAKVNILISSETDKLFELQHKIALFKSECMEKGDTAAKAKVRAEALPEFLESQKLKAKIDMVAEMIRISKLQARMRNDEKSNY